MKSLPLKRAFDLIVAGIALGILAVPMGVLCLLIRIFLGSPIFFRQERPGLHGKIFRLVKFRTMREIRDEQNELVADHLRMTRLGKVLRSLSLDELPELFNVLRGEMSLVGPRPLLPQYLCRYTPQQARRHEVRPGITGWAQVKGRNALCWPERFELDVWYVDHHTLGLDLKILFLTVVTVLKREGVAAPGSVTMPEFEG